MNADIPFRQSDYVEVIVPLPLDGPFTYHIPDHIATPVMPGMRVIVPFGSRKFYTGVVRAFSLPPEGREVKDLISVLDTEPVVRRTQLQLWDWMARYYLCSVGEVFKAALPAGLKIESETKFEFNPDFEPEISLNERQTHLLALLKSKGKLSSAQIAKLTSDENITSTLNHLLDIGAVMVSENLNESYRPKTLKIVAPAIARYDDDALRGAFEAVKGARRQEQLFQTLLHLSQFTIRGCDVKDVEQSALLDKSSSTTATLKALRDKGLIRTFTRTVSRFSPSGLTTVPLPELSEGQQRALAEIHGSWVSHQVCLLHGVTGSGKTEVYIHLIDYVLRQGRQVLYLVPEIALTTQLTTRLQRVFGDRVVIYHSRFTDNERVDIWRKVLSSTEPCMVIGARSAVFLPLSRIGLIIVDEEHEPSYKQTDPAPRYNGRDAAIMLASMHGACTLLGSATPAVDTYYKAQNGKYGLVTLKERFGGAHLPKVELVNMSVASQKKEVNGPMAFSTISCIRNSVRSGHQAIVFNNRRGFSPIARCGKCEYIPRCLYCDVSLTWHRSESALVCHYCGTRYPMPQVCPNCKEPAMHVVGYGTERVEDEIDRIFPEAKTLRMDLDTTRSRTGYDKIISTFSSGKADILVGTQMVTKGLNFTKVDTVAVLDADRIINYPDFRSGERAFNMLSQVAGRAGRTAESAGRVLIQTRTPDHPLFGFVIAHDYEGYYSAQLQERQAYMYPPFSRVIVITFKHRDEKAVDSMMQVYARRLVQLFGSRVSGPSTPVVARINSLYIRKLMLRVELAASMTKVKELLRAENASLQTMPKFSQLVVQYDVDPS